MTKSQPDRDGIDTIDEDVAAILASDDLAASARQLVQARDLSIERRLEILRGLEQQVLRERSAEYLPAEAETTLDILIVELRAAASSLYAQARDDFADRKEGEAIGDPSVQGRSDGDPG